MAQGPTDWIAKADGVARDVLAKHAADVDRDGALAGRKHRRPGRAGLLGLTVPTAHGGAGQGPRTFAAVVSRLAEQCASTAMIYLMHVCGTQAIAAAKGFGLRDLVLKDIAAGRHLSTLAFSEKGSRSHFWAPVSQAVAANSDTHRISADKSWVTSAGHADSYVVSTRTAGGDRADGQHALLRAERGARG